MANFGVSAGLASSLVLLLLAGLSLAAVAGWWVASGTLASMCVLIAVGLTHDRVRRRSAPKSLGRPVVAYRFKTGGG